MSALLIFLLVTSLVGGGMAYASQDALPGDPLYGVKMLVEDTRLLINTDEISDAELHLEFATERLEEAATLVAQGRPDFVEDLMAEYAEEIETVLAPLAEGVDGGDLLEMLSEALDHHQTILASLLEHVPEEAKSAIERAMAVSDVAAQVLETVEGTGAPGPPEETPVAPAEIPTVVPTLVPPTEIPPTSIPTEVPGPPEETPGPPSP